MNVEKVPVKDEAWIMTQIADLIEEEHELRQRRAAGELNEARELQQLRAAEIELDQCWDLLRQGRARVVAHQPPDEAKPRPASVVENYWQ